MVDKELMNFLVKIDSRLESLNKDIKSLRVEMNERFDKVDSKLNGIGSRFESTNESRINDVDFITSRVVGLEKEVHLIKSKLNS